MSKDDLSFWDSVKIRYARGDDLIVKVKHEDTGMGWIALSIAFLALVMYEIWGKQ